MRDYLDRLEEVLREGIHDLHDAADRLNLPYEVVCLTFNVGLLNGYWRIVVNDHCAMAKTG